MVAPQHIATASRSGAVGAVDDLTFEVVLEYADAVLCSTGAATTVEVDQVAVDIVLEAAAAGHARRAPGPGVGDVFARFQVADVAVGDFGEAVVAGIHAALHDVADLVGTISGLSPIDCSMPQGDANNYKSYDCVAKNG